MKKIRVGHASQEYPEQRNIINKARTVDYFLLHDAYSTLRKIRGTSKANWLLPATAKNAEFKFFDFDLNNVDIIHFFNAVSYGKTPWVSTFETIIPRFKIALDREESNLKEVRDNPEIAAALEQLASSSCKNIIAISKAAALHQKKFLALFPEFQKSIQQKLLIIHPPQPVMIQQGELLKFYKTGKTDITFMLVGHQFFSKGGREILSTFEEFRKSENLPIKLIIVSKLYTDNYATGTSLHDVDLIKIQLRKNQDWVTHYDSLPQHALQELMQKKCDIGLLPSYAETYGYSVLEFQSYGRPVITTNIRAFPEINNDDIGWVIPIPLGSNGDSILHTPDNKKNIYYTITNGLKRILNEIANDKGVIAVKGKKALDRIKRDHCPETYEEKIMEVYKNATGS